MMLQDDIKTLLYELGRIADALEVKNKVKPEFGRVPKFQIADILRIIVDKPQSAPIKKGAIVEVVGVQNYGDGVEYKVSVIHPREANIDSSSDLRGPWFISEFNLEIR